MWSKVMKLLIRGTFSSKDSKVKDLYEDMEMKSHLNGYMGCGLNEYDKKGEQQRQNFKFCNNFRAKAWAFFRRSKFQKDLIQ